MNDPVDGLLSIATTSGFALIEAVCLALYNNNLIGWVRLGCYIKRLLHEMSDYINYNYANHFITHPFGKGGCLFKNIMSSDKCESRATDSTCARAC